MDHKINIFSTALFSTWINVEDLNLLIDCGDGLSAGLMQKSRKIKYVFVTHPDRDHMDGLPQFVQLNAREDFPIIHFPKDSGSFPAMKGFLDQFDPHVQEVKWIGIEDQQQVPIAKNYEIQALRNEHVKAPLGVHKSLSYKLYEVKEKLKAKYGHLSSSEIAGIAQEHGKGELTEIVKRKVISFSGDTPVDDYAKWDHSEVLLHECTFLRPEKNRAGVSWNEKHSQLEDVLRMVSEINIGKLVLSHFSTRYSREEIIDCTLAGLKKFNIQVPVHLVLPGELKMDVLSSKAINE
ncbi:MBL fold metallo-hydrolase [Persicobacter diffluens]|uniref:MBL fold metallo-hydrolase n=1 Tax=Persicobacter diffluens TaxID=981 RepID=A0AAN4VZM3_9BACT|nr:MBL fold metallo-hydrolase [Persicobacter diffluens]